MYGSTSIENIILTILALVVIFIFGGAIYAFILSIFQFVFSKGDAEKVKKAWNNIRYMILGVIFAIFLLLIFPLLFQKLKITGYKVYTAKNIFNKASDLIKKALGSSAGSTNKFYTPSSDYSDYKL